MAAEIGPKSFGTFQKQASGNGHRKLFDSMQEHILPFYYQIYFSAVRSEGRKVSKVFVLDTAKRKMFFSNHHVTSVVK